MSKEYSVDFEVTWKWLLAGKAWDWLRRRAYVKLFLAAALLSLAYRLTLGRADLAGPSSLLVPTLPIYAALILISSGVILLSSFLQAGNPKLIPFSRARFVFRDEGIRCFPAGSTESRDLKWSDVRRSAEKSDFFLMDLNLGNKPFWLFVQKSKLLPLPKDVELFRSWLNQSPL